MAITAKIKLKECIYMYSDAAKQSDATYRRLWNIAFRGFTIMGLSYTWQPKTVKISVNANATVTFPTDLIQWISVNDIDDEGGSAESIPLTINDKLSNYNATADTRVADVGVAQSGIKIDAVNKVILMPVDYEKDFIELKYISSPVKDEDYEIPLQFQEAMIKWLSWQDIADLPSTTHVNNNTVLMRAQAFKNALNVAKKLFKPFRLQEANYHYLTDLTQSYEL